MAKENIDRGTKGILSKEKRYSIFSLARNTLNYHQNWKIIKHILTSIGSE